MPKLTFYRQKRADRGVRTGISLDGETVFHHFQDGEEEPDPALVWFVDLRCEGASVPDQADEARKWLIGHARLISGGFKKCAHEFRLGIDPDIYPLTWSDFPDPPTGVKLVIVYAAARHAAARQLGPILKKIGANWKKILNELEPLRPASR